jgi:hypothetical protein
MRILIAIRQFVQGVSVVALLLVMWTQGHCVVTAIRQLVVLLISRENFSSREAGGSYNRVDWVTCVTWGA